MRVAAKKNSLTEFDFLTMPPPQLYSFLSQADVGRRNITFKEVDHQLEKNVKAYLASKVHKFHSKENSHTNSDAENSKNGRHLKEISLNNGSNGRRQRSKKQLENIREKSPQPVKPSGNNSFVKIGRFPTNSGNYEHKRNHSHHNYKVISIGDEIIPQIPQSNTNNMAAIHEKVNKNYGHFKRTQVSFIVKEFGRQRDFSDINKKKDNIQNELASVLEKYSNKNSRNISMDESERAELLQQTIKHFVQLNNKIVEDVDMKERAQIKIKKMTPTEVLIEAGDQSPLFSNLEKLNRNHLKTSHISRPQTRFSKACSQPEINMDDSFLNSKLHFRKPDYTSKKAGRISANQSYIFDDGTLGTQIENKARRKYGSADCSPNKSTFNPTSARINAEFPAISNLIEKPSQRKNLIPNQLYLYHIRNQSKMYGKKDNSLIEIEGRVPPLNTEIRSKTPSDTRRLFNDELSFLNSSFIDMKSNDNLPIIQQRAVKTQQRPRKESERRSSEEFIDFKVEGWEQDTDH